MGACGGQLGTELEHWLRPFASQIGALLAATTWNHCPQPFVGRELIFGERHITLEANGDGEIRASRSTCAMRTRLHSSYEMPALRGKYYVIAQL